MQKWNNRENSSMHYVKYFDTCLHFIVMLMR